MTDFIFSKISYFQHIFLNKFRRSKYENYSLRRISFQILKQQSDYKSLIAKVFDGKSFETKAVSSCQSKKNKKQCFQLYLDQMYTLVLTIHFLCARTSVKVKLHAQKEICPPLHLYLKIVCFSEQQILSNLYEVIMYIYLAIFHGVLVHITFCLIIVCFSCQRKYSQLCSSHGPPLIQLSRHLIN